MKGFSTCSVCQGCRAAANAAPLLLCEINSFFNRTVPFITGEKEGWRMKAKLAIRKKNNTPVIGLFQERSHEIVDAINCPMHHPAINRAAQKLLEAIIRLKIEPYDENNGQGALRYAQFFVCRKTNRVQLTIVSQEAKGASELAESLGNVDWHSIWINIHLEKNNKIFGTDWRLFSGERYLKQPIGEKKEIDVAFHPGAFAQANLSLFDRLLTKTKEWIPPNSRLLEVYAGVGAISLHAFSNIEEAILVEDNPLAHESFLASLPPSKYRYVRGDAKRAIDFIDEANCIIVDPPRKGLDPILLQALQGAHNKELIYISCSFDSFQRDATALIQSGWELADAAIYWLFPGTEHLEIATKWHHSRFY